MTDAEQGKQDAKNDVKEGWLDPEDYTTEQLKYLLKVTIGATEEYINAYISEVKK